MSMNRTFDWRSRHDERSKNYSIRSLLTDPVPPRTRMWREGTVLDQGSEGACVGFGWTGHMLTSPLGRRPVQAQGNKFALDVYKEAQKVDYWPGEDYEGTSVLAGAQTLQSKGLIESYRWAFGIEDVRDALLTTGPVVIGIPWFEGMYYTKPGGVVEVSGDMVGGHCILLTGYYRGTRIEGKIQPAFRWRNSWGLSYGLNGSAKIKWDDLAGLLEKDGEACIPMNKNGTEFKKQLDKLVLV